MLLTGMSSIMFWCFGEKTKRKTRNTLFNKIHSMVQQQMCEQTNWSCATCLWGDAQYFGRYFDSTKLVNASGAFRTFHFSKYATLLVECFKSFSRFLFVFKWEILIFRFFHKMALFQFIKCHFSQVWYYIQPLI